MTQDLNLPELRRAAEAATQGPWSERRLTDDECNLMGYEIIAADGTEISSDSNAPNNNDALYICHANPATILALLDRLERSESARDALREALEATKATDELRAKFNFVGSPAGAAVPTGWKLVPVEPTENMVIAGFESRPERGFVPDGEWEDYEAMSGCQQAAHRAKLCYAAMLAAAPPAPSQQHQHDPQYVGKGVMRCKDCHEKDGGTGRFADGSESDPASAPSVQQQVPEVLAALKPFADAYAPTAAHDDPNEDPQVRAALDRNTITPTVSVGDFRRAYETYRLAAPAAPSVPAQSQPAGPAKGGITNDSELSSIDGAASSGEGE